MVRTAVAQAVRTAAGYASLMRGAVLMVLISV